MIWWNYIVYYKNFKKIPNKKSVLIIFIKRRNTRRDLHMNAQIGYYDMDFIRFELGSNVNIIPKQTWEIMGKPKVVWSLFQHQLVNQLKVLIVGQIPRVFVAVEGL